MPFRFGLGPVFRYEWLTTTRRWQLYAVRSLFVTAILAAITFMWVARPDSAMVTTQQLATLGISIYLAMVFVQLSMVLLMAPASTAGAVCLDKARGTLDHILATELTNSEVVLGKLAVRLIPVIGIVMSLLPAMVLTSLLGGVDPDALFGSFLVTLGTAIFACTLAMTLSVWGTKTHEVLFTAYFILLVWIMWALVGFAIFRILRMDWVSYRIWSVAKYVNPYYLVLAPYNEPGVVGYGTCLAYFAGCLILSAGMVAIATNRLRAICRKQAGKATVPGKERPVRPPARWKLWARGPRINILGPTLDGNPVLWREWQRTKPTRWMKMIWGFYATVSAVLTLLVFIEAFRATRGVIELAMIVTVFQVNIGLLLLMVQAATSLSEERMHGSLDILLTTPLTTLEILAGKWWGNWRILPKLMFFPAVVSGVIVTGSEGWSRWALFLILVSGYGAVAISVGLACATSISRLDRAITTSIGIGILANILIFVLEVLANTPERRPFESVFVSLGGSVMGTGVATLALNPLSYSYEGQDQYLTGYLVYWCVIQYLIATGLFLATWGSFNHYLGRVSTGRNPFRRARKSCRVRQLLDDAPLT